ncbi:MAG TPA: energy transducer TonB [Chitinophagaceae bacterium]|nr:energy transducer TonB [Chitinophagaceae bacterium]
MRKIILYFSLITLNARAFSQPKDFEGVLTFKVQVTSKLPNFTDFLMARMLATSNRLTVYVKHGNYMRRSTACDEYYITSKQRVYMKFKSLDTLYYLDYNSDTSILQSVRKLDEVKMVAGHSCKVILITNSESSHKLYYDTSLYQDPFYDRYNTIGSYNVYAKETSSIWLADYQEGKNYILQYECVKVESKPVEESVFDLPALPIKKFSFETVLKAPAFKRAGGWLKYLSTTLNADLGAKYVKIPKNEKEATQTVVVQFLVSENGAVTNAEVLNKKEVHPKLAEEALRVVSSSPPWTPGSVFGERIPQLYKQNITFSASKE